MGNVSAYKRVKVSVIVKRNPPVTIDTPSVIKVIQVYSELRVGFSFESDGFGLRLRVQYTPPL
jgi:hypothetical protein